MLVTVSLISPWMRKSLTLVTVCQGLTFINLTQPSQNKNFYRQVKVHAINFVHTRRRKEAESLRAMQISSETPLIPQHSNWNCDPFVRFPTGLSSGMKEFLHNCQSPLLCRVKIRHLTAHDSIYRSATYCRILSQCA